MILRKSLLFPTGLFLCVGLTVESFSVTGPALISSSWRLGRYSTCLFSEDEASPQEDHGEHTGEEWQLPDESSSDILNSPAFLSRKIDVLKSDIAKTDEDIAATEKLVEEGKQEWQPQMDSLTVEFENISNRLSEQSKSGDADATILVARKFLEVLDIYDRAFGVVTPETDTEKEIEAAYRNTYQMIINNFESLGIKEVETVGTEFDYEVHQAVMQRPSEYEEGIVCEELAKGYILGDKLIRAAMVSVAA